MLSLAIVDFQPSGKIGISSIQGFIRHGIGPFLLQGSDEPLGLAIGFRGVGFGEDVALAKGSGGIAEEVRFVPHTIVGHNAAHEDALSCKPASRPCQKIGAGLACFIAQNLHVSHARMIVDGDMNIVIAKPAASIAAMMAKDAMSYLVETTQFFDIEMDKIARSFSLIASGRFWWCQQIKPVETQPLQSARHSRAWQIKCLAYLHSRHAIGA